eukprot:TRINITY_DN2670_c0_g3_i1.p1 TRINITY_DN2670_c0_g3~~TRINITY_DN2670_c0_g3_i1.p1  ORF type:complete len:404 (-),score=86.31 TRINITY_DN2670_c0_g3_i1:196-1407(-)
MANQGAPGPRHQGGGMLFPSGEDANPLNRRLPAEVVTRRRREVKKVEEKPLDEVQVELKVALSLKPEARLKWLGKACKMTEEGRASATDLYDIVSSRKFASGLPSRIGKKVRSTVFENLMLFSDKQQRYLKSDDWQLNVSFGDRADGADRDEKEDKDGEDEDDKPQPPPPPGPPPSASTPAATTSRSGGDAVTNRSSTSAQAPSRSGVTVVTSKDRDEAASGGVWTVAEDASARQRAQALERAKREEAKRKADKQDAQRKEQESRLSAEQEESRRRALESEVDSSLMLLERLGQNNAIMSVRSSDRDRDRDRDRGGKNRIEDRRGRRDRKGGMSRSRSISAGSASSSRGGRDRRRKRSRSRGKKKSSKEDFADALRRRMMERESEVDSARIPVVDPGHAKRWK